MVDLTGLHKHFILEHIKEGDTVVDFTMGNGNDTSKKSDVTISVGSVDAKVGETVKVPQVLPGEGIN